MGVQRIASFSISFGLLLLTFGHLGAADIPDLGKIDRGIAKEPAYRDKQPLYGLYVFGPDAKTRAWAIFDKSGPDATDYDVLYFDRNADGDLTAPDKRIVGKVEAGRITFDIGSFTDPLTKQKHTEMSITREGGDTPKVMLRMKWCDKVMVRGATLPMPARIRNSRNPPPKPPCCGRVLTAR